jgi:hypothetical protein
VIAQSPRRGYRSWGGNGWVKVTNRHVGERLDYAEARRGAEARRTNRTPALDLAVMAAALVI